LRDKPDWLNDHFDHAPLAIFHRGLEGKERLKRRVSGDLTGLRDGGKKGKVTIARRLPGR